MFEDLFAMLNSPLGAFVVGLAGVLAAVVVYLIFAHLLSRLIGSGWSKFVGGLLALAVLAGTIKLLLDILGAQSVLVILATALTGALAIGSESIASDFLAGLKLFSSRPFRTGNLVQIGGHQGLVREITLTNTVLVIPSGERIVIRNFDVLANTIVNYSARSGHMIAVQVSVPSGEDLEKVIAVIRAALKDFSPESAKPECAPNVICEAVTSGQMVLNVQAYVSQGANHGAEKTRLLLQTIQALKKNKIDFGG